MCYIECSSKLRKQTCSDKCDSQEFGEPHIIARYWYLDLLDF